MNKDFDSWNKRKKELHESSFNNFVHEKEIWWCAVGANIGVEADGKHSNFERPVLILRKFSKQAILVVCLTSRIKKGNPYHIVYIHDGKEFSAVVSQIRLVSTNRLVRKIFEMSSYNFNTIQNAISDIINKRPRREARSRKAKAH